MQSGLSSIKLMLVDILDQPIKNLKVQIKTANKIWHSGVTNASGLVEFTAHQGCDLVVHVEHWVNRKMKPVARFFTGLEDMTIKLVSPKVKQTIPLKPNGEGGDYLRGTYQVKAGDTLAAIAKAYDVAVDYLAFLNGMKNINKIAIGQILKVPPVKSRSKFPQKPAPAPTNPPHSSKSSEAAAETANGTEPNSKEQTNSDGKPVTTLPGTQPAVIFPLRDRPLNDAGGVFDWNDWTKAASQNAACFGSVRSSSKNGRRRHAGRDLYAKDLSEVQAMAAGKVLRVSNFYCKTHAITIHHKTNDGREFVIRYGEVDPETISVKVGQEILQGHVIGRTGILKDAKDNKILVTRGKNVSMLHFELYSGAGGIDRADNLSGGEGEYERRSDLLDPITILQEGYVNSFKSGAPTLPIPSSASRKPIENLRLSAKGEAFIKDYEKLVLKYYEDHLHYCTVGWGHLTGGKETCANQGIKVDEEISLVQAQEFFEKDKTIHENIVVRDIGVPLYQHEFDALVSLAFNIGSLLRKAPTLCGKIKAGDYSGGASEFLDITNGGNKGLVTRRKQENSMFLKAEYDSAH
jgi:GH24 family phage-related lysozyme (muramidase)/murein DD-endopeptidase MepM/ murein hydrolase activator NlpD